MRTYSEKEVREIMRRALSAGAGSAGASEAVSLAELERVADEMGVPPERVREAALALDAREAKPHRFLFGVPNRLEEDRTIETEPSRPKSRRSCGSRSPAASGVGTASMGALQT